LNFILNGVKWSLVPIDLITVHRGVITNSSAPIQCWCCGKT